MGKQLSMELFYYPFERKLPEILKNLLLFQINRILKN